MLPVSYIPDARLVERISNHWIVNNMVVSVSVLTEAYSFPKNKQEERTDSTSTGHFPKIF